MKKSITRDSSFCDECKKETYINKCLSCKKEYCWECWKNLGREYKHAVHFGGSGDEHLCFQCVESPKQYLPLILCYQKIAALRQEEKGWYEDFNERSKVVEDEIKKLRSQYGLR